jgi:hypothetical protein
VPRGSRSLSSDLARAVKEAVDLIAWNGKTQST